VPPTPDRDPCSKCGRVHPRCTAHNNQGLPCGHQPAVGQTVCRFHGGSAPKAIAKAERRETEKRIAAALVSHGIPLKQQHPLDGLLEEVYRSAAAVDFYAMLIADLRVPDPTDPLPDLIGITDAGDEIRLEPGENLYGVDHNRDGAPHVLVNLWNAERTWHARVCEMALRAGVQERTIQLAETEGRRIVTVLTSVLDHPDLDLTKSQRQAGRVLAARVIRDAGAGALVGAAKDGA
jgi:hypothetical protein